MPTKMDHVQDMYASLTEVEKKEVSRLVKRYTDAVSLLGSPVESIERIIKESIEIVIVERDSRNDYKTLTGKDRLLTRTPYSEYRDYSCYYG